jgi:hypothetical protein
MPIAWMISSNATEPTIDFFLATIRVQNPKVIPKRIMSDFDKGQLNRIEAQYPKSQQLLCWWHVPHAWQQHFVTAHYPELWETLKKWYRITDEAEFNSCWKKIQSLTPDSFIEYINTYWLLDPVKKLWSGIYRKNRAIFELGDTNMLVEAYVASCQYLPLPY